MSVLYYGLAVLLHSLVLAYLTRRWKQRQSLPTPPGPPSQPLIGNILQVSPQGAWLSFTELRPKYGDLIFFHGLGNSILVLNSLKAINDLFDKRGNNYSNRPSFTVVGELMGLGQSMPLLPYGTEWREQRKLAHMALNPTAVKKYHVVQEDLAALLCADILKTPDDFFSLVRLTAGRIILAVTYGLSPKTADSDYITDAEETMELIGRATVPGAFLCDLIPSMKYLPSWVPFQREATKGRAMIENLVTKPLEHVKREMENDIAPPSLARDLLSTDHEERARYENRVKWATGSMYGGKVLVHQIARHVVNLNQRWQLEEKRPTRRF
ncbi:hypothetical protein HGRIS_014585 [Hohenbuehelia grisea]|uniref:Cytochrome P450 n=1 Tax=Hohenbuehelia grisea TaxID=104357 RepID=A0ABR3JTZ8_9AGAR